jgi:hypothetical protein
MSLATWAAILCPFVLLVVLVPLTILVYRERRRRREAQLTSVYNARARRERGD